MGFMGGVVVRGQGSTEFLVLFAAAVAFFGVLYSVTIGSSDAFNSRSVEVSANQAANDLAAAAKAVYAQGAGARKIVSITLPKSYDPATSRIDSHAIIINTTGGAYVRTFDFSLQGTLPNASGVFYWPVENDGTSVTLGPAVSGVNRTYLSSVVVPGANYSDSILLSSYSLSGFNGTVSATWDNGSVNLSFTPSSFSLLPLGQQQISLFVNTSTLAKGTYTGRLLVSLEGNGTAGNQSFQIPVVIVISSTPQSAYATISFLSSTPANGSTVYGTVTINATIQLAAFDIKLNWNGTNYSYLDGNAVLMLNLDNNAGLGENAATAADASRYANNGTISGASWTSSGKYRSAVAFDGSAAGITFPSTPGTGSSGNISTAAWVQASDTRQNTVLSNGVYSLAIGPDDVPYFEVVAGGEAFASTGKAQDVYVAGFAIVNGSVYAAGYGNGTVSRYDGGTTWASVGYPGGAAYAITTFNKTLFVGDYTGTVYRYGGGTSWTSLGNAGGTVYGLIGYGNDLYAGLYDTSGTIMRYAGGTTWSSAGSLHVT